jgi:hypothetical protein
VIPLAIFLFSLGLPCLAIGLNAQRTAGQKSEPKKGKKKKSSRAAGLGPKPKTSPRGFIWGGLALTAGGIAALVAHFV